MKFNWGYKIAAVYIVFVVGMMYLVVRASQQNIDLVTPDYYAQELKYQDRIDESNRAASLSEQLQFSVEHNVLTIKFPSEFAGKSITGNVLVYCPSNKENDISRTIAVANNTMNITIPEKNTGAHELQVSWEVDGVKYYFGKSLFIQ
ncbi:MAG TPA: FixH family protein [Chitinophagaceae bacterium]|nr:FixH family protein [Chitinophagaceae bacterium]